MSRWQLLGVIAIVALGILGWVVLQDDDAEPDACAAGCEPQQAPAIVTADVLARRYAPVLYLRNQSSPCSEDGDPFDPMPVEVVLGNGEIALRKGGQQIGTGPAPAQLFRGAADLQLDYPGNPLERGCGYYEDGVKYSAGKQPTSYVRIVLDRDEGLLAVQYWFFYYFNPWNNRHEGDWEMVQLVFEATTLREAYDRGPSGLGYSQHSGGESAKWQDGKLRREGDHPAVYVAQGSHANFYGANVYLGRGEERTGVGCEETRGPHRRTEVELVLLPGHVLEPASPFAWITYQGGWGEQAGGEFDGPTGPNTTRAWRDPFAWQASLRTGSVRVPDAMVGPSATNALCDIIIFVSRNFLHVLQATPALGAAAIVLFVLGGAAGLTRTTYLPVVVQPLAASRKLGQILTTAFTLQLRRSPTYAVIGLLSIPFAFVASGLEWVVLHDTPLGGLSSIDPDAPGQRALLLISFGQAQITVGYALVTMITIAALAQQDQGKPASVRQALRLVFRRLPQLVAARIGALAVMLGLALTVVGLPLALRQAVRWAYLEQAILLDGLSLREAFRASNNAASTEWWWSFGTTVALAAVGIAAAPVIGIVLLLAFRSLDLTYVNLATSAVYVAVAPYVAIALTLVYLNLKTLQR